MGTGTFGIFVAAASRKKYVWLYQLMLYLSCQRGQFPLSHLLQALQAGMLAAGSEFLPCLLVEAVVSYIVGIAGNVGVEVFFEQALGGLLFRPCTATHYKIG